MRLFVRSARPLLAAAEAWVAEGRLPDTHAEFFIVAGALSPSAAGEVSRLLRLLRPRWSAPV